jgi:hypothetical protein
MTEGRGGRGGGRETDNITRGEVGRERRGLRGLKEGRGRQRGTEDVNKILWVRALED